MVDLATIFTQGYDTFKSFLNTDVVDPKTGRTNSNRRWFYRDIPDTTSHNFSGYPFIVINHADFNDDFIIILNNDLRENELVFRTQVHAEFDDPDARCDTISQAVLASVMNKTNITAMEALGCFSPKIRSTSIQTLNTESKQVVARFITITYVIEVHQS